LLCSESAPPREILGCELCTEDESVRLLRVVIGAMGRSQSPEHKHLFFKFQSALNLKNRLLFKAFPSVPWIFVHRDPVEVLVSHLGGSGSAGSGSAVCLKTQGSPAPQVLTILPGASRERASSLPEAQYCAAFLGALCTSALEAAEGLPLADAATDPAQEAAEAGAGTATGGGTGVGAAAGAGTGVAAGPGAGPGAGVGVGRAYFLRYDAEKLPQEFIDIVLPLHFHIAIPHGSRKEMLRVAGVYSKVRWK
jgi:hypothetical protein